MGEQKRKERDNDMTDLYVQSGHLLLTIMYG